MTQSIENIIINSIRKCERGCSVFPFRFSKIGEKAAVLKDLEQMTYSDTVIMVTRGIYYYPKIDKGTWAWVITLSHKVLRYLLEPQCPVKAAFPGQTDDIVQLVRGITVSVDGTCELFLV